MAKGELSDAELIYFADMNSSVGKAKLALKVHDYVSAMAQSFLAINSHNAYLALATIGSIKTTKIGRTLLQGLADAAQVAYDASRPHIRSQLQNPNRRKQ